MVHLVRGTQENSLTADKAAELRSAWTGEGVPSPHKQNLHK